MISRFSIVLDRVEIRLFIGVHDFEKAAMQRYQITTRVHLDPSLCAATGYYDYDGYMAFLNGFEGASIETQEEFANRLVAFFSDDARVEGVELQLRKPDVFANARGVGLDLEATFRR